MLLIDDFFHLICVLFQSDANQLIYDRKLEIQVNATHKLKQRFYIPQFINTGTGSRVKSIIYMTVAGNYYNWY